MCAWAVPGFERADVLRALRGRAVQEQRRRHVFVPVQRMRNRPVPAFSQCPRGYVLHRLRRGAGPCPFHAHCVESVYCMHSRTFPGNRRAEWLRGLQRRKIPWQPGDDFRQHRPMHPLPSRPGAKQCGPIKLRPMRHRQVQGDDRWEQWGRNFGPVLDLPNRPCQSGIWTIKLHPMRCWQIPCFDRR